MTAGTKGTWSGGGETDGELLVATADRLRWRAPELALVFARHAATRADADQDRALALRANALVVAALVRLGKHAEAVEPAVLTLREAESSGARELAGSVRVDLAASTRAIGLAGSAFVLVRPMLEGSDARPSVRAGALAEIVAGLAQAGRREVIDEVLSEADRLYAADDNLGSDVRRVLRALLCARIASFRRRWGNPTGAVAAATEGMTLLDGLTEPATDSGQARAELGLEMVSALLDAGEDAAALGQADQTLNHPVRATSAAAVGRLMLVLATRVHMPSGRPKEAHALLAEIVRVARRHELDGLLADVLTSLAHAQEADGDLTDALDSLRSARAAEQRRLRADTMARLIVLEELGAGTRLPDDTEALLRRVVRTPARSLPDTSGREYTSLEATSREMSGRELGGEDIGTQDVLARELTGWEMVARERAAMEASSSRALSDLIEADRAALDWPTSDRTAPDGSSGWPSNDRTSSHAASARSDLDRTSSDWIDSEFSESGHADSDRTAGTGMAATASSGGGRRRAPVEWSAADRVAADRAVSELASADSDDHVAAVDGSQPKWPDPSVAEERDEETGLLNRQGLRRRLAAARRQARPTALTLVRLEPTEPDPEPEPHNPDPDSTDRFSAALIKAIDRAGRVPEFDPDVLSSLADHVRDMAPDDAELVRPEEGELAVLMPDTTRDEAEQFAATLRETVSTSDWDPEDPARGVSVSTGVAQYQEGTSEDALLTAAREDLTSAESDAHPDWQSVEPVYDLPPEDSGYTYVQEYAQLSHDGPEPADPEMAEYLAGFSLPEYGQWSHTEDQKWSHTEEPDMPPRHDIPTADKNQDDDADTTVGRSVLDRLEITRGSGGRRRAPDSFAADQSADYAQYPPSDSPYPPDTSQDSPGDAQTAIADSPYQSDTSTYSSDRSPNHAQTPPPDWPYSSYPQYPPDRPPTYGSTGDEILAAAEEAARAVPPPEPSQEEAAYPETSPSSATHGESPQSSGLHGEDPLGSAPHAEDPRGSAARGEGPQEPALHEEDTFGSAAHGESPLGLSPQAGNPRDSAAQGESVQSPALDEAGPRRSATYAETLRRLAMHGESPQSPAPRAEKHDSAPRASIPHVPDPEEVPVPPDAPDIPEVPNPDIDPQPGRRRYPRDPDPDPAHTPGRPIPKNPDIDPAPDWPSQPADPDPDRHGFPVDPDPDPRRDSDRRGYAADRGTGRRAFPADSHADSRHLPADSDLGSPPERGGRRRAPDGDAPQPRLRFPDELEDGAGEQRPGRRRMPEQAGQDADAGQGSALAGRRRRIADYLESVERPEPEAAAGRRRSADQADSAPPPPSDPARPAAEHRPSPQPRPKPEPKPEPEPDTPKTPEESRSRRWASILDGQERPGLPPEPAEPRDPPIAAKTSDPGKPSRNRRRDKTDVKLADLLAEALVAYQASTSDNPAEDVLSAYDDAAGRVADDTPRRERETGY